MVAVSTPRVRDALVLSAIARADRVDRGLASAGEADLCGWG